MAGTTINNTQIPEDREMWLSLQRAIAKTSGFNSWCQENQKEGDIEELVAEYLRFTLETLAY
ncbi:MAG: hypothetical protein NZ901_04170 [Geminocystis sp.]|nr:hypothetical protein [Geminocystis sp.]HIK38543.1 hypothetical protein [Geminocystis sp. M7585_C2015_104]MCS7147368.1 hypothetical protein [Geminocystis sp.]MCX8079050.1 hypothetical protein [Geminocystis sp.]MDW8116367.1 hypothetical protein [Geminocystis sp.]